MKSSSLDRIKALAEQEITAEESQTALEILKQRKVALFIVAYNAEEHLEKLIDRIPVQWMELLAEIFVIDDSSTDTTYDVAQAIQRKYPGHRLNVYRTPFNRGYGGNQKLGYMYCVEKGYDIVILLHGDGQYAPEYLPRVLAAAAGNPDAVFASRMIVKRRALRGGMPFYKWIGNQVLSAFENVLLGTHLSEFHTGYRAYSLAALQKIPFGFNSDDFHFDTEIIVQAVASGWKIKEVSIPAFYGKEKSHVTGLGGIRYAWNCARAVIAYRLVQLGLYYRRNYDFGLFEVERYQFKTSPVSLHQHIIRQGDFRPNMKTVELGANHGIVSSHISERVSHHVAVDMKLPDLAGKSEARILDLNGRFSEAFDRQSFDACVALDVIEHLNEPESFLQEVFEILKVNGTLYVSTANICYLPVRLSLFLGQFNYGKRGILDRTHRRLFSVASFTRMISQYGFKTRMVRGFPPPLTDLVSGRPAMRILERWHARLSRWFPNLFAYNFLVVATRMDALADVFDMTIHRERYRHLQQAEPPAVTTPRDS